MTGLPFKVGRHGRDTHTPEGIAMVAIPSDVQRDAAGQSKSGFTPEGHPHDTDTLAEGVTHPVHPSGSVHDARSSDGMAIMATPLSEVLPKNEQKGVPSRHALGPSAPAMMTQGELARVQGFTGDTCTGCGGFSMRRNGTCLLCVDCGATTGCS